MCYFRQFSLAIQLIRLHKPVPILFVLLPSLMSLALYYKTTPIYVHRKLPWILFINIIGAIVARSLACIVNDWADRKFDQNTQRCKNRPFLHNEIHSNTIYITFSICLIISAFCFFQFSHIARISIIALIAMVMIYPYTKRFLYNPQLFLALTINLGIIINSINLQGRITNNILLIYLICIYWTILYDTIYAFNDIEDDIKNKIKSNAIRVQSSNTLRYFQGIALKITLTHAILGVLLNKTSRYYAISVILFAISYYIARYSIENKKYMQGFNLCAIIGVILLISLFV